jgi:hypothetical protein
LIAADGLTAKASRGAAHRTAALDRAHDPQPQVQRHRCRHDNIPLVSTKYCRITGVDSMQ